MKLKYCKQCVMDGSADITLDDKGVCNFCHEMQRSLEEVRKEKHNLDKWIESIRKDGEGKRYDCLIGLSGGADSSTVLHEAVKLGLRPLCFSVDNGWNNPLADENIMRMVESLKVPFYRYTIDLPKFRELQAAFMIAGVPNLEIPTDHILMATTFEMANKYGIKWILSGGNVVTEGIMPPKWGYNARDLTHIKAIYKKVFGKRLKGIPLCGLLKWNWYRWVSGIKTFYLLDYLDYDWKQAKIRLNEWYGWKDYHEKHCESIFTWWFQNYYLFTKFGFDKRKAHYSSLINAGQMKREEAVELIGERPVYPEIGLEKKILNYPKHKHKDYAMDKWYGRISKIIKWIS